jgi:molybdopterin biosynthesis enzyme
VYRRARVAVLSTGDELVEPGQQQLKPGQIRDANRAMLAAAVSSAGCRVIDLGIALDDPGQVEARFQQALDQAADVLLTSGAPMPDSCKHSNSQRLTGYACAPECTASDEEEEMLR